MADQEVTQPSSSLDLGGPLPRRLPRSFFLVLEPAGSLRDCYDAVAALYASVVYDIVFRLLSIGTAEGGNFCCPCSGWCTKGIRIKKEDWENLHVHIAYLKLVPLGVKVAAAHLGALGVKQKHVVVLLSDSYIYKRSSMPKESEEVIEAPVSKETKSSHL